MYRMQYHFETPDDDTHDRVLAGAMEVTRLALEKGIEAATVWVSEDERTRRVVFEFTGTDKFDCDRKQAAGTRIPEIGAILDSVFKRRLTSVELYQRIDP